MLEFFVIFSKSGIVLFATVNQSLNQVINGLVKHVFIEERTGNYQTDQLQIKYHLDNEFELIFVIGYQKFLQLSYVDKFLSDVHLAFRDKYSDFDLKRIFNISFAKQYRRIQKNEVSDGHTNKVVPKQSKQLDFCGLAVDVESNIVDFSKEFSSIYQICLSNYASNPKQEAMRTFQDSAKSKKTVASMVVQPQPSIMSRLGSRTGNEPKAVKKVKKESSAPVKKGKAARQWDLSGSNPDEFDFSKKPTTDGDSSKKQAEDGINISSMNKNIESSLSTEQTEVNLQMTDDESSEDENSSPDKYQAQSGKSSYLGSLWTSISFNKTLSLDDLRPVLDQLRDHLISKNVAAEIADELCKSVGVKLQGQSINSWSNLKKFARDAVEEAVLGILSQGGTINILREIQAKPRPPYVIAFCGVNGVGKSTNLAKIANWLINNQVRVLVIACDTFRAGAIEQLKTHVMALKAIHERKKNSGIKIELFEKGYARDSAAVAMDGINYARVNKFNCVLIDTAGRMQDNEPLMKQLAKLIKINTPDLTLFVGEALVGNEAVDQLDKFNKSLIDNGCRLEDSSNSAINGIVLTKFDTIDDQVGAAISMTYVTAKPIVFVGVGQTYKDLKQLDARAVTKALMR